MENVVVNVYAHKLIQRISTSTYGDRSKFGFVIAGALNMLVCCDDKWSLMNFLVLIVNLPQDLMSQEMRVCVVE